MLPQEVELAEKKRKDELAEKQWFTNLKRWREWLNDPEKASRVREEIGKIDDPLAVPAFSANDRFGTTT